MTGVQTCALPISFGETAQPTEMGLLPPFMLKTIVIDQMNDTTLLSVSQACEGFVGIFTSKDCKVFNAIDVIPHLQDISKTAHPVMSGKVEEGLYLLDSN